VNEI